MNILNNKNKRISIFKALALCLFAAVSLTAVSCDDDMDIQQSYPFTVETMPVPNKVSKGQTVEIRCELKKTGDFANTLYTIRYFQFEGDGTLKMDNGITFLPNDRYLLENEKFRLYYTAQGDEAHNFIVVVEDNFGNSYELEFDFNNRNVKDDGVITVVPIGGEHQRIFGKGFEQAVYLLRVHACNGQFLRCDAQIYGSDRKETYRSWFETTDSAPMGCS